MTAPKQKRGSHSAARVSVGRSERLLASARQRGSPDVHVSASCTNIREQRIPAKRGVPSM